MSEHIKSLKQRIARLKAERDEVNRKLFDYHQRRASGHKGYTDTDYAMARPGLSAADLDKEGKRMSQEIQALSAELEKSEQLRLDVTKEVCAAMVAHSHGTYRSNKGIVEEALSFASTFVDCLAADSEKEAQE